jgi:hypothetical protein
MPVLAGWLVVSFHLRAFLPLAAYAAGCTVGIERLLLSRLGATLLPAWAAPGPTAARVRNRLPAVELNTFYWQPRPDAVASWLADTPADFRFAVMAARYGSLRAFARLPSRPSSG